MAYANCAAAYKVGRAELTKGVDPDYFAAGDRDNDGVACELANAPAGFVAKPYSSTSPSTTPSSLPVTGAPAGGVIGLALLLLLIGLAVISVASKRYRGAHR